MLLTTVVPLVGLGRTRVLKTMPVQLSRSGNQQVGGEPIERRHKTTLLRGWTEICTRFKRSLPTKPALGRTSTRLPGLIFPGQPTLGNLLQTLKTTRIGPNTWRDSKPLELKRLRYVRPFHEHRHFYLHSGPRV